MRTLLAAARRDVCPHLLILVLEQSEPAQCSARVLLASGHRDKSSGGSQRRLLRGRAHHFDWLAGLAARADGDNDPGNPPRR